MEEQEAWRTELDGEVELEVSVVFISFHLIPLGSWFNLNSRNKLRGAGDWLLPYYGY